MPSGPLPAHLLSGGTPPRRCRPTKVGLAGAYCRCRLGRRRRAVLCRIRLERPAQPLPSPIGPARRRARRYSACSQVLCRPRARGHGFESADPPAWCAQAIAALDRTSDQHSTTPKRSVCASGRAKKNLLRTPRSAGSRGRPPVENLLVTRGPSPTGAGPLVTFGIGHQARTRRCYRVARPTGPWTTGSTIGPGG